MRPTPAILTLLMLASAAPAQPKRPDVVVPSQDRHRRDLYKTVTTDQAGRFSIRGLAEGRYTVFAWEQVEDGAWLDPDFLRGHENRGTAIRIRDGAEESVQLTAIR